jgi:hypothetical protein
MPPECQHHGQLKERVDSHECRIVDVEDNQKELRRPEEGALAKMHEKMNSIAKCMMTKSEFRWFIGVLVSIFIIIATASLSYTSRVETRTGELKERLDRETVTKTDLTNLKNEMKECLKEIKDEIKKQ